jgi:hypothetical protein
MFLAYSQYVDGCEDSRNMNAVYKAEIYECESWTE